MRCECCDKILTDSEATSKFADSGRYTQMCTTCQGFLPKEVRILTRSDLEEDETEDDEFKFEGDKDDEEEEE